MAGTSPEGGYFGNNLSACKSAGLVEYSNPGVVALTEFGKQSAQYPDVPPDAKELLNMILGVLKGAQKKIFQALWLQPKQMTREELAELAGLSTEGGYFGNNVSRLKTLMLCDYPKPSYVQLAEWIRTMQEESP